MRAALPAILVLSIAAAFIAQTPLAASEEAATLSGIVRDAATGEPIAGASVYAWSREGRGDNTMSDENGHYTLSLAAGEAGVSANAKRYSSFNQEMSLVGGENKLDIEMKPFPKQTASVSGIVRGSDGSPISGARVSLGPRYDVVYATDASAGGGSTGSAEPSEANSSDVASSPAVETDRGMISPIWYEYDQWNETTTDDEGRYFLGAYAGEKQLTIYATGYVVYEEKLSIAEGEQETVDADLEKAPPLDAIVRGRVVDAKTGQPLAGAYVSANNMEWGRYAGANADEGGNFEITLPRGYTLFQVSYYGGYPEPMPLAEGEVAVSKMIARPSGGNGYYTWSEARVVESGDTSLDIKLEPKASPSITLSGYVVDDKTKEGIPNAWVNVRNEDTGDWGNAQTDGDGSWMIMVRPGRHVLEAGAEGHFMRAQSIDVTGATVKVAAVGIETPGAHRVDVFLVPGESKQVAWEDNGYCCYVLAKGAPQPAAMPASEGGASASDVDSGASSGSAGVGSRTIAAGSAEDANAPTTPDGPKTYSGGAGGLGPYRPAELTTSEPSLQAPGLGLVAGIVTLGVIALAAAGLKRKS